MKLKDAKEDEADRKERPFAELVRGIQDSTSKTGYFFSFRPRCRFGSVRQPCSIGLQNIYAGSGDDALTWGQQTSDGGFVAAGFTNSFGAGSYDAWVVKLDSTGGVTWQKTYGGTGFDRVGGSQGIQQTSDGGYIVAGQIQSFGAGGFDFWVLKLTSTGTVS